MWEIGLSTISSGILDSAYLLLPTLAVALLYAHGRYLPIWIPDVGLVGAYGIHAITAIGKHQSWGFLVVLLLASLLAVSVHRGLLSRFIDRNDPLNCLLIGVGLSTIFQSAAAIYGNGMSQHYSTTPLSSPVFVTTLGISVYPSDIGALVVASTLGVSLATVLSRTLPGLKVKAVIANRELARHFNLPVRKVDIAVVLAAAMFATLGAVLHGIRYDLQPRMMFFPSLIAIAACVAAGPGRLYLPLAIVAGMNVLGSILGTVPALSQLQRALPFALMLIILAVRGTTRGLNTLEQGAS